MKQVSPQLGKLGTKFFALMQTRHQEIVRLGELAQPLSLTHSQEHELLKRLAKNGLIFRLMRGIYLLPEKLPASRYWQPFDYYLITQYMAALNASYYVGGMAALHHYGFTTQIPAEITVYNTKVSGDKQLGSLRLKMIKIPEKKIGDLITIPLGKDKKIFFASAQRLILDAIQDWKQHNIIYEAYDWIKEKTNSHSFVDELINSTIKYGNKGTSRRIGYLLENNGVSPDRLRGLCQKLQTTKSWVLLDPAGNSKGKTNNKWGIINNVKST